MKWSRQLRWLDHREAPARLKKSQLVVPANLALDAQPFVELNQVDAAAEQHVLAVVHHFASAGMLIRGSASAKIRPALKQGHAKAARGKGASGSESRQSAAHHRYSGILR